MGIRKSFGFGRFKNTKSIGNDTIIIRRLKFLGEQCVSDARRNKGGHPIEYEDQTHNLRSSIGFRIYKDGNSVYEGGFEVVSEPDRTKYPNALSGDDCIRKAKEALDEYGLHYASNVSGWVLIIVAGMNYAKYVEAKGYNVLHQTNIMMQEKVEELKKELGI